MLFLVTSTAGRTGFAILPSYILGAYDLLSTFLVMLIHNHVYLRDGGILKIIVERPDSSGH